MATASAPPAADSGATTLLVPASARTSLKRARILFDGADVAGDGAGPDSSASARSSLAAATSAFVPPLFDPAIHRAAVARRIRARYPSEFRNLALKGDDDDEEGEGAGDGGKEKESATDRALRELRHEALERLRAGEAPDAGVGGGGSSDAGEGRLVLHRESDLNGGGATTAAPKAGGAIVLAGKGEGAGPSASSSGGKRRSRPGGILVERDGSSGGPDIPVPKWHAPWKLATVLSSHLGGVRSVAFDPSNTLFATGAEDRVIKVFDLAKACVAAPDGLKITLTGHISAVRGLAFSDRHPYLFSAGEDKMVKCWDLETNQVIRHYHGHLSGIYALKLHPTLDLLVTGGRDAVARVWDMRTKHQIHCLAGHDNTVGAILTKGTDPQIITGSYDSTIKLWDLAAGKCMTTLTHHKKSVRALAQPSFENTFLSGAADNLKKWVGTDGRFAKNFTGHKAIINALAVNDDGVVLSAGNDGTMNFWDYGSGYCFQKSSTVAQPGSLDAENGIYAAEFDLTGTRLVTCEADKTVKIWKEDEEASELTHPVDTTKWRKQCIAEAKRRY
ncbi:hypothetical protein ACHAWF_012774 [Thalassiosira exigua]